MNKIITQAKEDLENMDYGEVQLALEKLENKINRMNELYPKWAEILDYTFQDAYIHGWQQSKEDGKILSEFGQLLQDIGIRPITNAGVGE